eukprot:6582-Heterococcus_DN1.PRE.3
MRQTDGQTSTAYAAATYIYRYMSSSSLHVLWQLLAFDVTARVYMLLWKLADAQRGELKTQQQQQQQCRMRHSSKAKLT